jgi:DNA-binding LacI/PurR family transcriptional regulator
VGAGLWAGCSDAFGARFVRGFIDELGRGISTPRTPRPNTWDVNTITATWLGHASVLVNFYGVTILTDPVLMQRIGANFGLGTVGPKRLIAPALTVEQLPKIDVVLLSHAHFDHFDMLKKYDIPVVFFDRVPDREDTHSVSCKLESGMLQAVDFLLKRNHTCIAFISGPKDLLATKERMKGYENALRSRQIPLNPEFVVHSDLSTDSTRRAMQRLLTLKPEPTAVIAFNDYVALDAIRYARKEGLKINKDIFFGSYANLPIIHYLDDPPIVSVEQFPFEQAEKATDILLQLINRKENNSTNLPQKIVLEGELVLHED